jgi:DNA processing protein
VHERIRNGAVLVTHGSEVLEVVGGSGQHLVAVPRAPEGPRDRLSTVEQQVLEAVPMVSPARVDSIADVASLHVRITDPTLRRLRDLGFVELLPAGWRQCREPGNAR